MPSALTHLQNIMRRYIFMNQKLAHEVRQSTTEWLFCLGMVDMKFTMGDCLLCMLVVL